MFFRFILNLFFLYAIQGIPYGIQSRFLPVYLRSKSFSLTSLGLLKLLYIPWILKTFYAPIVDIYWTKITWLKLSVFLLFLNALYMSMISCNSTILLLFGLFSFNLFSATQDISLDGIMISQLSSSELSIGNIAQVVGYKFGAIFGGGFLVMLSYYFDWHSLFIIVSCIYLLGLSTIFLLNKIMISKSVSCSNENNGFNFLSYCNMFKMCFNTPGTKCICFFILIYKLGEQGSMNLYPLFLLDKGRNLNEIGFWTGIVGQIFSICGSSMAAVFIKKKGMWSILYLISVISIPLHCVLMFMVPIFMGDSSVQFYISIFAVNVLLFVSGIRTTTTFSLMMKSSQLASSHIQSTHYTMLSTVEVVGKLSFGTFIGLFADYFGYFISYFLFFVLSILLWLFLSKYRAELLSIERHGCCDNLK